MDQSQIVNTLTQKTQNAQLPKDVLDRLSEEVNRVAITLKTSQYTPEIDREISYINFVSEMPWNKMGQDILDLPHAKKILDQHHHGLEHIKDRILEYLSILILNHQKNQVAHQPILAFLGLVGSGKTSLAYSIADCLGRPIIRIPFGGLGSALQLRGESRVKVEAEPGLIIKSIKRAGVKNPVILLDELDRVTEEARADIMGVLVELLDPEQNMAFTDHYVGMPFDLSNVLFIATANNTGNIATAVMDRLELIEMPFYTDDQKITIAKDYLLPQAIKNAGLSDTIIQVEEAVWPQIVRPLGFDGGIRSLKRNIDSVVRKIARQVVEGNYGPYPISPQNIEQYFGT